MLFCFIFTFSAEVKKSAGRFFFSFPAEVKKARSAFFSFFPARNAGGKRKYVCFSFCKLPDAQRRGSFDNYHCVFLGKSWNLAKTPPLPFWGFWGCQNHQNHVQGEGFLLAYTWYMVSLARSMMLLAKRVVLLAKPLVLLATGMDLLAKDMLNQI